MHTVNVRHYNNKQHHSPTRGGESMACVGDSGLEWVGLREWMVCAVQAEITKLLLKTGKTKAYPCTY